MSSRNFTTTIEVENSPDEVYKAVNNPRAWWSDGIEGTTDKLNAEWNYHFGDNHRSKLQVVELVPNERIVWLVMENYFKNAKSQSEWVGNRITFEISRHGKKTRLVFSQIGLIPENDCYKACDWAWTGFVQTSLRSLITGGKGDLTWYQEK